MATASEEEKKAAQVESERTHHADAREQKRAQEDEDNAPRGGRAHAADDSKTRRSTSDNPAGANVVESAPEGAQFANALGEKPERDPSAMVLDKTTVKIIDGEPAAATEGDTGAFGIALPPTGEIAGGNIAKTLAPPAANLLAERPYVKEQAAMLTETMRQIAPYMGRPPTEWGIIGPGETIRGHMLLLDLNSGEKVRAMDGHRVGEGGLYINLRNVPESLSFGNTVEKVLEAS